MASHFDMSELFHHFLSDIPNRGRTHACLYRAFEKDPYPPPPHLSTMIVTPPTRPPTSSSNNNRYQPSGPVSFSHLRQRSFFFAFKYYTVVGDGLEPAHWQRYDKRPNEKRLGDHVDIAECGSILALSLEGDPIKPLRTRPRRERTREGFLFDTFGPWHLLSIQSFPDDEHTVRGEEFQKKSFYNGPYAFLDLLIAEYKDAGKRNQILHERITKLITPPTEFMFDRKLRDKLLFEDKHFTYIRRYFWAYNTLAVVNNGIKSMIAAYFDTFTEEFWAGDHPLLWPVTASSSSAPESTSSPSCQPTNPDEPNTFSSTASTPAIPPSPNLPSSTTAQNPQSQPPPPPQSSSSSSTLTPEAKEAYLSKLAVLRRDLDKVVSELGEVLKRNERTRKEIENLRDQLFSGSSIKESRRAIDQGDNIRILTMISMIFLPLTFVTSVFGMTEFSIPANDWRFAIAMILVCVPFMIFIFLLQTRLFTLVLDKLIYFLKWAVSLPPLWVARLRDTGGGGDDSADAWSTVGTLAQQQKHQHQQHSAEGQPTMGRKRRLMAMMENRERGQWPWDGWLGAAAGGGGPAERDASRV